MAKFQTHSIHRQDFFASHSILHVGLVRGSVGWLKTPLGYSNLPVIPACDYSARRSHERFRHAANRAPTWARFCTQKRKVQLNIVSPKLLLTAVNYTW
jgi:hypothetical protein